MKLYKPKEKYIPSKRYLIPSVLMVGLVPLLMHQHTYDPKLAQFDWFPYSYSSMDFFLWIKQLAVVVLGCVCLILLLERRVDHKEEFAREKFMIPAAIYGVMIMLSAIFGKSPYHAFAGSYEMFESALTLFSYLIIAYYTYVTIVSLDHLLWFLRWSEWFVLVELVIAAFQAFGLDLFLTDFGKRLYISPSNWGDLDSVGLKIPAKQAYGTIYNVDYFSMYLGVLVPIFVGLIIVETKLWRRALNAALCVLAIIVATHGAISGMIGIAGAFFIGWIVLASRNKKTALVNYAIIAALVLTGLVAVFKVQPLHEKIKSTVVTPYVITADQVPVENIYTDENAITYILKDGRSFSVQFNFDEAGNLALDVKDGSGNPLNVQVKDETKQIYIIADEDWSDVSFARQSELMGYTLNITYDHTMQFTKDGNGEYKHVNVYGKEVALPKESNIVYTHVFPEGLFTRRGMIYNYSIPLLKKTIVIGAGANNFIQIVPQWDYVHRIYMNNTLLDAKPHSYYLQLWIEEGFIAFAALLTFFGWYFADSTRLYRMIFWKKEKQNTSPSNNSAVDMRLPCMGFAIFLSVMAYLIVVLVNDSTICTAPVFWTILGAGCAVNRLIKI